MIGDEDLDSIFESGDFDEDVILTLSSVDSPPDAPEDLAGEVVSDSAIDISWSAASDPGAESLTIRAWFTGPTDAVSIYGDVAIEAQKPTVICKTIDVDAVSRGDVATVRSTDYTIERIEKIGTGASVLYLKT